MRHFESGGALKQMGPLAFCPPSLQNHSLKGLEVLQNAPSCIWSKKPTFAAPLIPATIEVVTSSPEYQLACRVHRTIAELDGQRSDEVPLDRILLLACTGELWRIWVNQFLEFVFLMRSSRQCPFIDSRFGGCKFPGEL